MKTDLASSLLESPANPEGIQGSGEGQAAYAPRQKGDFDSVMQKLRPENNPGQQRPLSGQNALAAPQQPSRADAVEQFAAQTAGLDSAGAQTTKDANPSAASKRKDATSSTRNQTDSPSQGTAATDANGVLNALSIFQSPSPTQLIAAVVKTVASEIPASANDGKGAVIPADANGAGDSKSNPSAPKANAVSPSAIISPSASIVSQGNVEKSSRQKVLAPGESPASGTASQPQATAKDASSVQVPSAPAQQLETAKLVEQAAKTADPGAVSIIAAASQGERAIQQDPAAFAELGKRDKSDKITGKPNKANGLAIDGSTSKPRQTTTGTGIALEDDGMKNSAEKNNLAGRAMQNPPPESNAVPSAGPSKGETGSGSLPLPTRQNSPLPAKDSGVVNGLATYFPGTIQSPWDSQQNSKAQVFPVETASKLIQQEVLTVRHSDAKELAVSLKVDSNTQLFVRITNTNGRIQATVECERGSSADLSRSLPDLQASLAKHNISLMAAGSVQPAANSSQTSANSQNGRNPSDLDQQSRQQAFSAGQEKRQTPGGSQTIFGAEESSPVAAKTATKKQQAVSRTDGWEQWA